MRFFRCVDLTHFFSLFRFCGPNYLFVVCTFCTRMEVWIFYQNLFLLFLSDLVFEWEHRFNWCFCSSFLSISWHNCHKLPLRCFTIVQKHSYFCCLAKKMYSRSNWWSSNHSDVGLLLAETAHVEARYCPPPSIYSSIFLPFCFLSSAEGCRSKFVRD